MPWMRDHAVWLRLTALVVLLVAVGVLSLVADVPSVATVRGRVERAGPVGPVLFVLTYAAVTLAPLPKNVLSAAAGAVFGLAEGVALVYVAALLGAAAAFGLGRGLGRAAVERLSGGRLARIDAMLSRRGMTAVLVARLVPVVPFTALNYAAGLVSVRRRDYAVGTAVGIIPGTVAYVAVGSYASAPGSWPFEVALGGLVLLSLAGVGFAVRRRRAGNAGGDRR